MAVSAMSTSRASMAAVSPWAGVRRRDGTADSAERVRLSRSVPTVRRITLAP